MLCSTEERNVYVWTWEYKVKSSLDLLYVAHTTLQIILNDPNKEISYWRLCLQDSWSFIDTQHKFIQQQKKNAEHEWKCLQYRE